VQRFRGWIPFLSSTNSMTSAAIQHGGYKCTFKLENTAATSLDERLAHGVQTEVVVERNAEIGA